MKEIVFLNNNAVRWKEFEKRLISEDQESPDLLAELYIKITDDLSFAQTNFSGSETEHYLNSLASKTHQLIYRNKKEPKGRFRHFWKVEVPNEFFSARKYIFYALILFIVSCFIGIVSSANDGEYIRLILGDSYVNMTVDNIEKGNPMAVYGETDQFSMFVQIAYNNVKVMIFVYLFGLFFSVGSIIYIFIHGVMIGSFHFLFFQHNMLEESLITVWIHGTFEIFTLLVSGGAGILMGNSILFPNTYSRKESFIKGAGKSSKLIIALIPFILLAAFLESFVTRHTEINDIIRIGIIIVSLIFIIVYFFIYPITLNKKQII